MLNSCSALDFQQFDIYIDHIWKFLFPRAQQRPGIFLTFLTIARKRQPKIFPNIVNIYTKLLEI